MSVTPGMAASAARPYSATRWATPSSPVRNATANGIVCRAVPSTSSTARQVSAGQPDAVADTAPNSRTTRIRRWYNTFAVVSVATDNMPAIEPSTSVIGLCE